MMSQDTPLNWPYWLRKVLQGQREFSLLSRKIIVNLRPDLFRLLPFKDDRVFLDPLLFAAYASADPGAELDGVTARCLFGDHQGGAGASPSIANDGIGLQPTGLPDPAGPLALNLGAGVGATGPSGSFAVYSEVHRLLRPLFKLTDGTTGSISEGDLVGTRHRQLLQRSLKQISIAYPSFYLALEEVTRGFLVFRAPGMNSFASETAHGISFLSVPDHATVPYFVDDIAHQCGHIVFSAMFFDREKLFEISAEEPVSHFTGIKEDDRSIFVVFHAVFTEHTIAHCLEPCLDSNELEEKERDEVRGRLAFIMKKYELDLGNLRNVDVRAEDGYCLYRELEASFNDLYARLGSRIRDIDLSGQPYNFNYGIYTASNCSEGV